MSKRKKNRLWNYYERSDSGHECPNCHAALQGHERFCPACGQLDRGIRLRFRDLIYEFISNVLNLDAKFYQSLRFLFIPASLTRKFFQGKRGRFIHPIRLYLFAALIFTAVVSLYINKAVEEIPNLAAYWETDMIQQETILMLDSLRKELPDPYAESVDSALYRYLRSHDKIDSTKSITYLDSMDHHSSKDDTLNLLKPGFYNIFAGQQSDFTFKLHKRDLVSLEEDEIIRMSGAKNFLDRVLIKQSIKLFKDTRSAARFGIGSILWTFLMIIPAISFFQYFLFGFRRYFYVEHIVFGVHTHSVFFLLASAGMLIEHFGGPTFVIAAILAVFAFWLLLAMRFYYRRSWIRTIFNYLIINWIYSILALLLLSICIILRFMIF